MEMYKVTFNVNKLYSNQAQYDKLVEGTEPYGYIYAWENLWNWNMYVGQTIDLDEREKQHIRDHKQVIDGAIDKYGEENFDRYIIDVGYSKEELDEREKYWIAYYDTFEGSKHYNCTEGGEGVGSGENNPAKRPEVRAKMSETRKGKYEGEKNPMYGKTGDKCPKFKGYILVTNVKTGEFVGVYAGTCEVERELKSTKGKKLDQSAISKVLKGKYKYHGGYYYKRISVEEYEALLEQQAS